MPLTAVMFRWYIKYAICILTATEQTPRTQFPKLSLVITDKSTAKFTFVTRNGDNIDCETIDTGLDSDIWYQTAFINDMEFGAEDGIEYIMVGISSEDCKSHAYSLIKISDGKPQVIAHDDISQNISDFHIINKKLIIYFNDGSTYTKNI